MGIGIPAVLIFNQLGYSSNVFITFIEFNGIGFVALAISIILFIKNSDKKRMSGNQPLILFFRSKLYEKFYWNKYIIVTLT
ncbi:hypothetical protein [Lactococcus lactis]|nr:hypothetical protein [Lactococcus lactis]